MQRPVSLTRVVTVKSPTSALLTTLLVAATTLLAISSHAQPYAYVTNSADDTVSVINAATNTVVGSPIAVGSYPYDIAFTPDGTQAYVTNGDGTVSVINTATNCVASSIPVGSYPSGIAFTPDGTQAYVTNGDGTVSVINTATTGVQAIGTDVRCAYTREVATVTLSCGSGVISTINYANYGNSTLGAYCPDIVQGTCTGADVTGFIQNQCVGRATCSIYADNSVFGDPCYRQDKTLVVVYECSSEMGSVGSVPRGVAITPDGTRAYAVTNYYNYTVSVIDTATNSVVRFIPLGNVPYGIAITPDGTRAYVTNSGYVSVINTATNTVVGSPIVVGSAQGIAITPDGTRAYVTNPGSDTVSVIDTATKTVVGSPIPVGSGPVGIAITPDGTRAYVTNKGANTVSVIDTATNTVVGPPIPVVSAPIGIAIQPRLNVPACCGDSDRDGSISTAEATKAIIAVVSRDAASDPAAQCTACGIITTADATKVILNLVNRTCNR